MQSTDKATEEGGWEVGLAEDEEARERRWNQWLENLKGRVADQSDIMAINMRELRDAYGKAKLKRLVIENIEEGLAREGLGHIPADLPHDHTAFIHVYRRGTRVAALVNAVLGPNEDGVVLLREAAGSDAAAVLRRIRELVCP